MTLYRTAKTKVTKMTVRIPAALQSRLKQRAHRTNQSLNRVLVEALAAGLEIVETRTETERERTLRVLREAGLWEPLGPEWDKYVQAAPDVTLEEVRAIWEGKPSLSEAILEDREPRE